MKVKLEHACMLVLSIVIIASRFLLIAYDPFEEGFVFELVLPKIVKMGQIYFIDPPLIAAAAVAIFVSVILIKRTYKPLFVSGIALVSLEFVYLIEYIVYLIVVRHGQLEYSLFTCMHTSLSFVALAFLTYIFIRHNKRNTVIYIVVAVLLLQFLNLYLRHGIVYSEFINITLISYYLSIFLMFALVNAHYKLTAADNNSVKHYAAVS